MRQIGKLTESIIEQKNTEVQSQNNKLEELISSFGVKNDEKKRLEKELKAENVEIKSIMGAQDLHEFVSKDYKAVFTIMKSESFDTEPLLEYLKTSDEWKNMCEEFNIVKTKEYIDMDALENAIYNEASEEQIAKLQRFKVTSTTEKLTVTKIKRSGGAK